jgi:hypothetical protein
MKQLMKAMKLLINEGNEGNEESIQMGVSKEKEKKPRSIKQQEALKKAQAARKT